MTLFNMVAQCPETTIVAEYTPSMILSDDYKSEAGREREFIRQLGNQSYEYLTIHGEADLVFNLHCQLEQVNGHAFTDSEWRNFFREHLANANKAIEEKTLRIQEERVINLTGDDGPTRNITLLDKKNIHNNPLTAYR